MQAKIYDRTELQLGSVSQAEVDEILRRVIQSANDPTPSASTQSVSDVARSLGISEERVTQILLDIRTHQELKQAKRGLSREKRVMVGSGTLTILVGALVLGSYQIGFHKGRVIRSLMGSSQFASNSYAPRAPVTRGDLSVDNQSVSLQTDATGVSVLHQIDELVNRNLTYHLSDASADSATEAGIRRGQYDQLNVTFKEISYSMRLSDGRQMVGKFSLPYYTGSNEEITRLVHDERLRRVQPLVP